MKKIIYLLFSLFIFNSFCFADETDEVKNFFNNYVAAANNYDINFFDYYSNNAKITRVVQKPDGSTQSVNIPLSRYKYEAKKSTTLAKIRKYKNRYFNIKISRHGNDYKISADRMPSTSTYKIPAEFIIGKDSNGEWKIKEETLNTKVQLFLNNS